MHLPPVPSAKKRCIVQQSGQRKRKRLCQVVLELTSQATRTRSRTPPQLPALDCKAEYCPPAKRPMYSRPTTDRNVPVGQRYEVEVISSTGKQPQNPPQVTVQGDEQQQEEEAMKVDTPPSPKESMVVTESTAPLGQQQQISPGLIQVKCVAEATCSPRQVQSGDVFRFDSLDRERFIMCKRICEGEEDVFFPLPRSPHARDSPLTRLNSDSPKLSISPLRIKDASIDEDDGDFDNRASSASVTLSACEHSTAGVIRGPPKVSIVRDDSDSSSANIHYLSCSCPHCQMVSQDPHYLAPSGLSRSPISPLTPSSPHTPSTPISPSCGQQMEQSFSTTVYLPELYRRRSHSDSDLQLWFDHNNQASEPHSAPVPEIDNRPKNQPVERESVLRHGKSVPQPIYIPSKGGSLESDTSTPQDSPLDLSVRTGGSVQTGSTSSNDSYNLIQTSAHSLPHSPLICGPYKRETPPPPPRSPGAPVDPRLTAPPYLSLPTLRACKESVALRYHLEVSPVVEEMPAGADVAFLCPVCGQMFSLHDRLAKHMASRHKSKQTDASSKTYICDVCQRPFARSDMLTRHMRLHTGHKPYTCRVCGQVFSRSDHLSTHQRTHTGEKPYKCPQCPYAACRRDMITRHMKTHTRYELHESSSMEEGGEVCRPSLPQRSLSDEHPTASALLDLPHIQRGVPQPSPLLNTATKKIQRQLHSHPRTAHTAEVIASRLSTKTMEQISQTKGHKD